MTKLILHAVVCHKPYFTTKQEALKKAHNMFPDEKTKTFVRETGSSFLESVYILKLNLLKQVL